MDYRSKYLLYKQKYIFLKNTIKGVNIGGANVDIGDCAKCNNPDHTVNDVKCVGGFSCEDQKKWGKCKEPFIHGKCDATCNGVDGYIQSGENDINDNCNDYLKVGKCGEKSISGKCNKTCQYCNDYSKIQVPLNVTDIGDCAKCNNPDHTVNDVKCVGGFSCEDQKKWGKCKEPFIHGKCDATCNGVDGYIQSGENDINDNCNDYLKVGKCGEKSISGKCNKTCQYCNDYSKSTIKIDAILSHEDITNMTLNLHNSDNVEQLLLWLNQTSSTLPHNPNIIMGWNSLVLRQININPTNNPGMRIPYAYFCSDKDIIIKWLKLLNNPEHLNGFITLDDIKLLELHNNTNIVHKYIWQWMRKNVRKFIQPITQIAQHARPQPIFKNGDYVQRINITNNNIVSKGMLNKYGIVIGLSNEVDVNNQFTNLYKVQFFNNILIMPEIDIKLTDLSIIPHTIQEYMATTRSLMKYPFKNNMAIFIIGYINNFNIKTGYQERLDLLLGANVKQAKPHITIYKININMDNPDSNIFTSDEFNIFVCYSYKKYFSNTKLTSSSNDYDLLGGRFVARKYTIDGNNTITNFRKDIYAWISSKLGQLRLSEKVTSSDNILYRVYSDNLGKKLFAVDEHYYGNGRWTPHVSVLQLNDINDLKQKNNYKYQQLYNKQMLIKGINMGSYDTTVDLQRKVKILTAMMETKEVNNVDKINMATDIDLEITSTRGNKYQCNI